jgi:hypothetical protein
MRRNVSWLSGGYTFLLKSLLQQPTRPVSAQKVRERARPNLEALEDRIVPSWLTVTNSGLPTSTSPIGLRPH